MAYTITSDISRMIVAGQKEIFTRNFDSFPIEYPEFTTAKSAQKKVETYDSMGNLPGVQQKPEGDAINYGKVAQWVQTSITNLTWANGYQVTIEAIKYDLYGVVNSVRAQELARTMREGEETRAILRLDNAFTTNLADGAPLCTNSRPLANKAGVFNDTLTTGGLTPDNLKTAVNMFGSFLNHQGGQMKSTPTDLCTHFVNMLTVEEILQSMNKAYEFSNTKNVLPKLTGHYSHYLASQTAWFVWDRTFEHVLFQTFLPTEFDSDEDKINTKNLYLNAIAMYETGVLPNIGIVGSTG